MPAKNPGENPRSDDWKVKESICDAMPLEQMRETCHEVLSDARAKLSVGFASSDLLKEPIEEESRDPWFDTVFGRKVEGGEFSDVEKLKRFEKLKNGEVVFRDVGLNFYKVQKGDTLTGIKARLSKYPEFSYLNDYKHSYSISCFNIPPSQVHPGMLIPIPLPEKERTFTNVEFADSCHKALKDLQNHPKYASGIRTILDSGVNTADLVTSMLAVAMTESGKEPIGKFSLHRFEKAYKEFSFTIFHIMNTAAGLRARKNLDMTIGQSLHPRNSAKLFLAYLCEKNVGDPGKNFPIPKRANKFATSYNGNWEDVNPDYPDRLLANYKRAQGALSGVKFASVDFSHAAIPPHVLDGRKGIMTSSKAPIWTGEKLKFYGVRVKGWGYEEMIKEAHYGNKKEAGSSFFNNGESVKKFAKSLAIQRSRSKPVRGEQYAVGKDEKGVFVVVKTASESRKFYYEVG